MLIKQETRGNKSLRIDVCNDQILLGMGCKQHYLIVEENNSVLSDTESGVSIEL